MNFELDEEQRAIQDVARKFTAEQITPHAAQWDLEQIYPREALNRAAELGFDDRFYRLWSYYLSYCEAGFRAKTIDVGHFLIKHRRT